MCSSVFSVSRLLVVWLLGGAFALFFGVAQADTQATAEPPKMKVLAPPPSATHGEVGSYLAGRYARQVGDADAASYFFSHSLSHDPYDENLMKQAVRTHVLAGRMDDAAVISANLSALYEGTQLSHLVLLATALQKNDVPTARKELAKIDPYGLFSVIQPTLEGWVVLAETGKPKEIAVSDHIKKLMVFEPFVAFQNALIFDAGGDAASARGYYEQAAQDMSGISYRNLLALVDFYVRQGEEKQARALYAQYLEENRTSQVLDGVSFEDVVADARRSDGKPFVATAAEGVAEEFFAMAGMLYGENVTAETQLYLRLALYLKPEMADALLMLGAILEEAGEHGKAIGFYDKIPAHGAVYRRAQVRKAFVLSGTERVTEALALLDELTKKYPKSSDVYVTLGDVYRKQSKFGKAVQAYTSALDAVGSPLKEHQWPVLFARGISYERDGEWDRAEKDFKTALDLYPDQPDVLNYLGYSWLMKGTNLEKAKEMLEQAVAERPEDAHIIDSMGWALYMLGDYAGALEYLEQAVNLMPNDPVVNDHLGDALWRVGRKTEARFQWEKALYFGPEDAEREKIEQKMKVGLGAKDTPAHFNTARD